MITGKEIRYYRLYNVQEHTWFTKFNNLVAEHFEVLAHIFSRKSDASATKNRMKYPSDWTIREYIVILYETEVSLGAL